MLSQREMHDVTAVILRNTREGEDPVQPPLHDDGTLYPYAMYFNGYKDVAFGDTPEDLLDVLIKDYSTLDSEQERAKARILLAVGAQVALQAQINAEVDPADWDALSDAEREALSGPRYQQPHGWGTGELGDVWESTVPLVLVETGYKPYTDIQVPISGMGDVENPENMIWLRPADEWEFLTSLSSAGYIGLSEATDL